MSDEKNILDHIAYLMEIEEMYWELVATICIMQHADISKASDAVKQVGDLWEVVKKQTAKRRNNKRYLVYL